MRTWLLLVAPALLWPGLVAAAESAYRGMPPEPDPADEVQPEPVTPRGPSLHLDTPVKFGVGLEGYAGIAAQFTSGEDRAHGLVGGLLRARFHYVEIGGTFEITDSGQATALSENAIEHWQAWGGFAGAVLPFYHWVDLEAAIGVSARRYMNSNSIYGAGGLDETLPSLTFRFGVSDRMTHKLVGPRLGAALAFGFDLGRRDVEWRREYRLQGGGMGETIGTTAIGGVSIGLIVGGGFEVGARSP
jgi:hypothetical protein